MVRPRPARGLTLRRFLLLLVAAGAVYVAGIALVITFEIAPIASELQLQSTRVLAAHDAIGIRLNILQRTIEQLHGVILRSRRAPRVPQAEIRDLIVPIRARLDSVAALRYSESLVNVPASMRRDLASAAQSEGELGIALLDALAELQLGRPDNALVRLRLADARRTRTESLLQSAQRSALADMVRREARLGRTAVFAGRAVLFWLAVGAVLLPLLAWFVRNRVHAPLRELEEALTRIAGGNLDVSLVERRGDEIGRLSQHFNAMTSVLRLRADDERRRRANLTERLGHLLEESDTPIIVFEEASLRVLQASRGAALHLGYAVADFQRLAFQDLLPPSAMPGFARLLQELRARRQGQVNVETRLRRQGGHSFPAMLNVQLSLTEDPPVFVVVAQDITEQREAERLREALREFSMSRGQLLAAAVDLDRILTDITAATAQTLLAERASIWRVDGAELTCSDQYELSGARHGGAEHVAAMTCPGPLLRDDRVIAIDDARTDARTTELAGGDAGQRGLGAILAAPVRLGGALAGLLRVEHVGRPRHWTPDEQAFVASMADFVAIAFEGAARRSLQVQLAESQRLESIGRLAGGVAHDFNNILTAVLSHVDLAAGELAEDHPAAGDLLGIQQAALRAADLTRQLLAFARRQVVQPRLVDLNRQLQQMNQLLRRVIGEDVELVTILDPELGAAMMDPTQLEQVVVNLAVNAHDAMPLGGKLTLRTSSVDLDREYVRLHPDATVGRHVTLSVTDTGTGMDEATCARVFEPFFTTKDLGSGTGLGLATAHGILRQAHGHIRVESRPGAGTTFTVYLPLHEAEVPDAADRKDEPPPRGSETILLVEDELQIRAVLERALSGQGYRVLVAGNGAEAMETARQFHEPIELLLTDVVMPLLNGRDLARKLGAERPETAVLFMSGYAGEALTQNGVVEAGIAFLPKPFTVTELARRVRETLDAAALRRKGELATD